MHILILPSWYISSYNALQGIFFKEQAEALAKYGNKVGVISIQDVGIRNIIRQKKLELSKMYIFENRVHTYRFQYLNIIKNNFLIKKFELYYFKRMWTQYIKEQGIPDIVHLHSYLAGDFALYIKEKYNIPFVVTEHNSGFARNTISIKNLDKAKEIFEKSASNIAVSEKLGTLLKNKFTLNFKYIPNIVNMDFFNIKKTVKKNTYDFIHIAYLDRNKNQTMLIRAFYRVFRNQAKIKLTIVGDGVEYDNLYKLIKELNMQDQILLFGRANREEVKNLLQHSDAFVLSSIYETFGVVVIEAMSCGLPVVATKCGGPESIVTSGKVGLLSDIDENQFSEKLLEMYNKRKSFNPEYIRKYVEENFSEKAVTLKLNDVYEKARK